MGAAWDCEFQYCVLLDYYILLYKSSCSLGFVFPKCPKSPPYLLQFSRYELRFCQMRVKTPLCYLHFPPFMNCVSKH